MTGVTQGGDDGKIIRPQRPLGVEFPEMYKSGEFIVVLDRETRRAVQVDQDTAGPRVNIPTIQQTIQAGGVSAMHRLFPTAKPRALDSKYPDLTGHYKVTIGARSDLQASMAAFERNTHVEKVDAIGIHPIYVDANDPYYWDSPSPDFQFDQWHYFDRDAETFSVQADLAWEINSGSSSVLVGVLDSGTVRAITNNGREVAGVAGGFAAGSSTDPATGAEIISLRIGWNAKCFGVDGYGFVSNGTCRGN